MSIDKDFVLRALLQHNYLPAQRRAREEFPPILSTATLNPELAANLASKPYRKGSYAGYDAAEYKLTRFNSVSRVLGMPHPLPYAKLCHQIAENWKHIEYISSNGASHIRPQQYSDGRILIMNGYSDTTEKASRHASRSFGNSYRVSADIANFFPSVYTHSISWALVGHEEAKEKKTSKTWFNDLDKAYRSCRRDETQGVVIGPATSNIAAEVILARVDAALAKQGFAADRYIDDFVAYLPTEDRAVEFVLGLTKELAKYNLALNIRKTVSERLPVAGSEPWIRELLSQLKGGGLSAIDVHRFLDSAIELAARYPEGSVLKFACAILKDNELDFFENLGVLSYYLMLGFRNPVVLPFLEAPLARAVLKFGDKSLKLGGQERLSAILKESTRLSRSDGMCWTIYLMAKQKLVIDDALADAVITSGDCFAILTLFWTGQHPGKVVAFCEKLDSSDLYLLDRYWPLLYTAYQSGMLPDPYGDGVFECLSVGGFKFF